MITPATPVTSSGTPPKVLYNGVYMASVVNTNDPNVASRVQLSIPQVLGSSISNWADPVTGDPVGPPATGTIVWAMFTGGDLNHPVYLPTGPFQGTNLILQSSAIIFEVASWGFTQSDTQPFIQAFDRNSGTTEYSFLELGSGKTSGSSNDAKTILWGGSPDGTTSVAHFSIYGGNPSALIADFGQNGVVITPVDGNTYKAGHLVVFSSSDTTINSTSAIQVNNLTVNVGVGNYKVRGSLRVVAAASGTAQAFRIQFNGTCTLSGMRVHTSSHIEASNITMTASIASSLGTDGIDTGSMANGSVYDVNFEGIIQASAAGTFSCKGRQATSTADETFTVQALSWMEISPV